MRHPYHFNSQIHANSPGELKCGRSIDGIHVRRICAKYVVIFKCTHPPTHTQLYTVVVLIIRMCFLFCLCLLCCCVWLPIIRAPHFQSLHILKKKRRKQIEGEQRKTWQFIYFANLEGNERNRKDS